MKVSSTVVPYGVRAEMREIERLVRSAGCAGVKGGRLVVDRDKMPPALRLRFDRLMRTCVRHGFY